MRLGGDAPNFVRNLLKRRLREAYRLQKELLPEPGHDILFVYNSADIVDFSVIFGEVAEIVSIRTNTTVSLCR